MYPVSIGTNVSYTVTGTATNGSDYATLSGTVFIPAYTTSVTIPVTVIDDNIVETGGESVIVTLTGTDNGVTAGTPAEATVTIADNDFSEVSIAATIDQAGEPSTDGEFTLTLTNPVSMVTTVTIAIAGTATEGSDYAAIGSTIEIPANATSVLMPVTVINDLIIEPTETVIVTLLSTDIPDVTIGSPASATVSITSEDSPSPITCTDDIPQGTDPGVCIATVAVPSQDFNTNWPTAILSWTLSGVTEDNGTGQIGNHTFNKGVTTVTYLVYDLVTSYTATCHFDVIVSDNEAPTFTAPVNVEIFTDANCEYDMALAGDVTDEADNCSVGLQATYSDVLFRRFLYRFTYHNQDMVIS